MDDIQEYEDKQLLAEAAAEQTVALLAAAIETHGTATWVLAGGSTPLLAYRVIADTAKDALDWTKVTAVIGDERIGALDSSDNNWHAAQEILGQLAMIGLRPESDKPAEEAAENYGRQLLGLPKADNGLPRLDVIWLGVGEDGHTLSLFPNHAGMLPTDQLVIAIHDSPKPPADRISLTFRALQGARNAVILASGEDKRAAVSSGSKNAKLPIGIAASIISTHEGHVTWLVDRAAAPTD